MKEIKTTEKSSEWNVKRFEALNQRFANHALAIRRLQRDDPAFKELCGDFEDAARAAVYWQTPPDQSEERARQYQDLVTELETEIGEILRK